MTMKECDICGKTGTHKRSFYNITICDIECIIPDVEVDVCDCCGEFTVTASEAIKVDDALRKHFPLFYD